MIALMFCFNDQEEEEEDENDEEDVPRLSGGLQDLSAMSDEDRDAEIAECMGACEALTDARLDGIVCRACVLFCLDHHICTVMCVCVGCVAMIRCRLLFILYWQVIPMTIFRLST